MLTTTKTQTITITPLTPQLRVYGTDEMQKEYEHVKERLAKWRWSHDAAWLRLVTRYVELRTELKENSDLLVLGARMNGGYHFSRLGMNVIRNWLCRDISDMDGI